MEFSKEQDFPEEAVPSRWTGGVALAVGAALAGSFMVLFLYNLFAWAILGAVVFALVSGFVITTLFLGIRNKTWALVMSPLIGFGLLALLWVLYKTVGPRLDEALQQTQTQIPSAAGRPGPSPGGPGR
jgi:hypothetical protein